MAEDFTPSVQVVADSVSPYGHRLHTQLITFHRWIAAELNTHRAFSKSAASSRAIPVAKTLQRIADERVLPLVWSTTRPGMVGGPPLNADDEATATTIWLGARDAAVDAALQLLDLGVHKSVVNRLLEPFMSHTVLVTGVDWNNFFDQRCSPLAQPEMEAVARLMRAAYRNSEPTIIRAGGWHLPFIQSDERHLPTHAQVRLSTARCARTSYLNHFGVRSAHDDFQLYGRLRHAQPPHWSPMEHVATPDPFCRDGNFTGWRQLRHDQEMN